MLGRKNKQLPASESSRVRRSPGAGGPAIGSTFSYYTSRPTDAPRSRRPEAARPQSETTATPRATSWRLGMRLPLWLLMLVVIVCAVKLLVLGTDPKVIILGKTPIATTYVRPGSTYEAAAQKLLSSSITNRTKLTANLDGTASSLQAQFPELQTVSLTVPLAGNRPIVYVEVAQPSVILRSNSGNYALNASGLVLAKVTTIPSGIPVAVDQSNGMPHPGKRYLPGSTIGFIRTVAYQFSAAHVQIATFVLPANAPYELDVRLEGKPYVVRFSLVSDALTQSGAAIGTIGQLGAATPANYVDVRVPGRVYYK